MLVLAQQELLASDGLSVNFKDITGTTGAYAYSVGSNIGYSSVDGVRFKIGTAASLQAGASINSGNFTQYVEYIKTAGSSQVVDGKTLVVGSVFIPQITGLAVPSGDTYSLTGYYNPLILATWLPTASEVALNLSINQLGQTGSTVSDDTYVFNYQIFSNKFTGTQAAVATNSYMVLTSTATYLGNTYRAGEYFTATDTSNIVASGYVTILYASSVAYASLLFTLMTDMLLLVQVKGVNGDTTFYDTIYQLKAQLDALDNACSTLNVDFQYATDLILQMQNKVDYLNFNSI